MLKQTVVIILQARMESKRLPKKVMKCILKKTLLEHLLERLIKVSNVQKIVVATTKDPKDNAIAHYCSTKEISVFRGSSNNVLKRYFMAAKAYNADVIVRLTADCPLIDPHIIEQVVQTFLQNSEQFDYVSNTLKRSYPRGMDTEVFSFKALEKTYREAKEEYDQEHVTSFIYNNPKIFRTTNVSYHRDLSFHRWTVDTIEDFMLIKNILESLTKASDPYLMETVLSLFSSNPKWLDINKHVKQNS